MKTNVEQLQDVLSNSIELVLAGSLSLTLLRIYSKFYLQDTQPSFCEKCMREMYERLKKEGLKMAILHDEAKNRTLKTDRKGLCFFSKIGHIDWDLLTDAQAIEYLKSGLMRENIFTKLPNGYLQPAKEIETIKVDVIEKQIATNQKYKRNKK